MLLETLSTPWALGRSADSTDASYPVRGVTNTAPKLLGDGSGTDGVHDVHNGGPRTQNGLKILPYGTDAAAKAFLMRVLGWTEMPVSQQVTTWVPFVLGEFSCALCTATGVAGGTPDASHLLCDTITLVGTTGNLNVSCEIVSPTGNLPGHIVLNLKGVRYVEFIFNMNASAVSGNCLFSRM